MDAKKVIYKYPIDGLPADYEVMMPKGAEILTIKEQHRNITLWALVDKSAVLETRIFKIVGTGHEFSPKDLKFIDSVIVFPFVWHIFEKENVS